MPKIDFSTIALILGLVIPGLAAKRGRRRISAQSFEPSGPTTELGELVASSLAAHLILLALCAGVAVFVETLASGSLPIGIQQIDTFHYASWSTAHYLEATALAGAYLCSAVAVAFWMGFLRGWSKLHHPILRRVESRAPEFYKRISFVSRLEERPLSFELFTGEAVRRRKDLIFFLEIQLRDAKGFITGELVQYAIVRDEEPHRPVVLRDAQFKEKATDPYQPMRGDRILVDLADALLVQVSYTNREEAIADLAKQDNR